MAKKTAKKTRKQILLEEANDAEIRASYYGRKTAEYFVEMRLAQRLRDLAKKRNR